MPACRPGLCVRMLTSLGPIRGWIACENLNTQLKATLMAFSWPFDSFQNGYVIPSGKIQFPIWSDLKSRALFLSSRFIILFSDWTRYYNFYLNRKRKINVRKNITILPLLREARLNQRMASYEEWQIKSKKCDLRSCRGCVVVMWKWSWVESQS